MIVLMGESEDQGVYLVGGQGLVEHCDPRHPRRKFRLSYQLF
eukprot:COSAG05_NODE_888_length_6737_cov_9.635583_2_plen_42_part_00